MTTECPSCGFDSTDAEWCDDCGRPILADQAGLPLHATGPIQPAPRCPGCGEQRIGRFCQACGYNFETGTPGSPGPISGDTELSSDADNSGVDSEFEVVINADRDFYERLSGHGDADTVPFPPYAPERTVPLAGDEARIGRSRRDGTRRPEIDLAEPPADIGVSHLHAVLMRSGDEWTIVDLGSYNGTRVDGRRLEANTPVPLPVGSTIHIGAWTAIRLRRAGKDGDAA